MRIQDTFLILPYNQIFLKSIYFVLTFGEYLELYGILGLISFHYMEFNKSHFQIILIITNLQTEHEFLIQQITIRRVARGRYRPPAL